MHHKIKNAEHDLREGLEAENHFINDYIAEYVFRGDCGDHSPTEFEQVLLIDAIAGLIGDDKLRALIAQTERRRQLSVDGLAALRKSINEDRW